MTVVNGVTDQVVDGAERSGRRSPGQRIALLLVTVYQGYAQRRPSPCRYYPSCSAYTAEAIERHGLWRGGRLAARRLLRCRPFGPHGIDLVPLSVTAGRHEHGPHGARRSRP